MKRLFLLAGVAIALWLAVGYAAEPSSELWLLSTREACTRAASEAEAGFCYWRLGSDDKWQPAAADEFFAADTATPVAIFIHGNDTDSAEAIFKGRYVYDTVRCALGEKPIRFVIWSWLAERVCRRRRADLLLKLGRCNEESYRLALWLDRFSPDAQICLIGHSFGPRIITGAMHLLAGGKLDGRALPQEAVSAWLNGRRGHVRAVLLAAASDAGSLAPGGSHNYALRLLERTLITENPCDRVLRLYPRLYGRCGPQALGFIGPIGVQEHADKLLLLDVRSSVGKKHDWRYYCNASDIRQYWAEFVSP